MISVGFPLGFLSRIFLGSHSAWDEFIKNGDVAGKPSLVIMGDSDQFTGVETAREMVSKARQQRADDRGSQRVRLEILEGCDHFFHGRRKDRMTMLAIGWLRESLQLQT